MMLETTSAPTPRSTSFLGDRKSQSVSHSMHRDRQDDFRQGAEQRGCRGRDTQIGADVRIHKVEALDHQFAQDKHKQQTRHSLLRLRALLFESGVAFHVSLSRRSWLCRRCRSITSLNRAAGFSV